MRTFSSLRASHGDLVPKLFQWGSGSVLPALLLFFNSVVEKIFGLLLLE